MTKADIHEAVNDYLSIFDGKIDSFEKQKEKLGLVLDRLALA
jgi:hypothetical protein